MMRRPSSVFTALLALLLLSTMAGGAAAQLEEEDLEVAELIDPAIRAQFDRAMTLFGTAQQGDSIPLFTQVVDELMPLAGGGDPEVLAVLRESLFRRSLAQFNFGQTNAAEEDLRRLLELEPDHQIARDEVSSRFARLFDTVRDDVVGVLRIALTPADAVTVVDGEPRRLAGTALALLAGEHRLEWVRPGYASVSETVSLAAGEGLEREVTLERESSVLIVPTVPADARITVGGRELRAAEIVPFEPPVDEGQAPPTPPRWFPGLAAGAQTLEISSPGFRPARYRLEVPELDDVQLEAIRLEPEVGTLVLTGLPPAAQVELDGRAARPNREPDGRARLELAPGSYLVSVTEGVFGRFEETVEVADQATVEVPVQLKPAVVLLGVLGGDEVGAARLRNRLRDAFGAQGEWTFLDRTSVAAEDLDGLGLDARNLRFAASAPSADRLDWAQIQSGVDESHDGALFLLAVLGDDLIASEAEIWIWPAPPAPPTPEVRHVDLTAEDSVERLTEGFVATLPPRRAVLGALVVDSPLTPGPVVAAITPGGPATGLLQPGDAVTGLAGAPVFSAGDLAQRIAGLEAGETVELERSRDGVVETVTVATGTSFQIFDPAAGHLVAPSQAIAVAAELQRESRWPRWVLQLNLASLLLRLGEADEAVRELRRIDRTVLPPLDQPGLGRATIDYLLGVALTFAGPRYAEPARAAFESAAASRGGRLLHDDGPLVAPRAAARLQRVTTPPSAEP